MLPTADVASAYTDAMETVFSSTIAAKAWLATAAALLAVVQVLTAARIYGRIGTTLPVSARAVGRVHRWSGRAAILLTLPVVFHCTAILGFETTDTRVAVHSVVGSVLYGVFAAKMVAVRDHGFPGWVLPAAGGTLFGGLAVLWLTSGYWYFTEVRFGL
jgi:hypothetical protein